jgi:magnesium transporter
MLRSHPKSDPPWTNVVWIDLIDATDDERAQVERATGLHVPTFAEVAEIESSSRVFTRGGAIYMSMPLPAAGDARMPLSAVGFVLRDNLLLTARFSRHPVFDSVFEGCEEKDGLGAREIFLWILEALVDRAADSLEHASVKLDTLSDAAFGADQEARGSSGSPKRPSASLRDGLRKLGTTGNWLSQIRDTLLGMNRIVSFVAETAAPALAAEPKTRLMAIRADLVSLTDYEAHLSNKVQFLLDATLGFINIEQNDVVKTLTVASVVGIPPVLVAGIYGMNFPHMPEYGWRFGYPFALGLIVVTGLVPLLWFKRRGWL